MNAPERFALPDIPPAFDLRLLPIPQAGVRDARSPLALSAELGGCKP